MRDRYTCSCGRTLTLKELGRIKEVVCERCGPRIRAEVNISAPPTLGELAVNGALIAIAEGRAGDHNNIIQDDPGRELDIPDHVQAILPRRLKRAHVAAALNLKPKDVTELFRSGDIKTHQFGGKRYRHHEVEPADLIIYAVDAGIELDWEAVAEEVLEKAA